jgi:uncharacterized protein (TIGR02466 family)
MIKQIFPTIIALHDLSKDSDFIACKKIIEKTSENLVPHSLIDNGLSTYSLDKPVLNHIGLGRLKSKIENFANEMAIALKMAPVTMSNSWFNVMGIGQRVKPHRHNVSVISGALYVNFPSGSVPLKLHNPLEPLRMAEMILGTNDLNEQYHVPECHEGLLLLFPGWMEHSSENNESDCRVVISFNFEHGPPDKLRKAYDKWRQEHWMPDINNKINK